MTFKCRQCPHREFISKTALHQHYRMSIGHPFCVDCDRYFVTQESLETHNATVHSPYECIKCHVSFMTQSSLEDHYRGKPIHPNCPRCGKGFKDQKAANEHYEAAHPRTMCTCGREFHDEDLPAHYLNSSSHPACVLCNVGLKDDAAYDEHAASEHPERRCIPCKRQFTSRDDLHSHYLSSPVHPKCSQCNMGFVDDNAFNSHNIAEHAPKPFLPPPGKEVNQVWEAKENVVSPPSLEPEFSAALVKTTASTSASWRKPQPMFLPSKTWGNVLEETPSSLTTARTRSQSFQSRDQESSTQPHLRHISEQGHAREPGVPLATEAKPGTLGDGVGARLQNWRSSKPPAESHTKSHASSERSWASNLSLSTNSTSTSYVGVPTPAPTKTSTFEDKPHSPPSSTSSFGSGSGSFARRSYVDVTSQSISENSLGAQSTDSASEPGGSPKIGADSSHTTICPPAASSAPGLLRCPLCARDPCAEPTTTLCGHVFCSSCITPRIVESPKCPRCAAPTLLYCLFRLHLGPAV
ncbi:hypothetical protein B0H10DRAFT_1394625 [Mycena sp. CBHHK59/15]|nr:hypothetical protein B0H10DRAFT_1394625 [Mycena sp. CBHHK59/15]